MSVLVSIFCGGPLALVAWTVWEWRDVGRPQPVDCVKVMAFAEATLPRSAWDARCTAAHWQDTSVDAEFRMPRREVAPWLAGTYPGHEPSEFCDVDLCLNVQYGETPAPSGAAAVDVKVTYEDGDTALVRLGSFTL
ncbi:hypothetical protein ACFC0D_14935 [Streptomyces sp. NPDC056222]|uniref:hypothetical protein n=1 Tax=Streptomyces sp. NPDC056222 TaxID=3345749 RepID=UPI0035D6474A